MTRHFRLTLMGAAALAVLGLGGSALADTPASNNDGRHEVCIGGQSEPNSPMQGVCVWVPVY